MIAELHLRMIHGPDIVLFDATIAQLGSAGPHGRTAEYDNVIVPWTNIWMMTWKEADTSQL